MQRAKRSTPRSSTRRCTRRRCSTCGIGCRIAQAEASSRRSGYRAQARPPSAAASRDSSAVRARRATSARRRIALRVEIASPSAGTTSSTRTAVDVPAFDIDAHNVTNAEFLEFVDAGGYHAPRALVDEDWEWLQQEQVDASGLLDRAPTGQRRPMAGMARDVRGDSAPAGLAGRTSARPRRARTRAGRDGVCRPRPSFIAPPSGPPTEWSARIPGATRRPRAGARQFRLRALRAGARSARIPRARAPGAFTIPSATAGNGPRRSCAVPGFAPMASYPEYSADFFDGQHFVHEGRVAGDRAGAGSPQLPQLVPTELSSTCTRRSGRWGIARSGFKTR